MLCEISIVTVTFVGALTCKTFSEGLPKKTQTFLFFDITKATQFRLQLKAVIPFISTTKQVLDDLKAIQQHKQQGGKGLLTLTHTNIAFSAKGLKVVRL